MRSDRLESALQQVAQVVEYPATPSLAAAVRSRIEDAPATSTARLFPRPRWYKLVVAVGVLVIAFAATLTFSPTARQAVADLLGVAGIHIQLEGEAPPLGPIPSGVNASDLGERVSLGEAQDFVDFTVRMPAEAETAKLFLDRSKPGGMVSFVFRSTDNEKILVTQFVAELDEGFFKKITGSGGEVSFPEVNGTGGYWVSGSHVFYYVADGEFVEETVRIAGPVLLWEERGVTYRIEGAGSLAAALEIAASLE